jgi:predicted ATPase
METEELNMPEVKRFWARNYKSLRDVAFDFPTKLTVVIGPSGSGKTALAEAFLLLSDASWRRRAMRRHEELRGSVGVEFEHGCSMTYEVRIDGDVQDDFEVRCPHVDVPKLMKPDKLGVVVGATLFDLFLRNIVVILDIDWKAVRSPQSPVKQTRLLPDASNVVPYLYTITRGNVPESLVEAVRYVFPDVRGMRFEEKDGNLLLKLAAADGAELDQTNMPAGVLKTLIIETALYTDPALLVVDEFENSLHPEAQQFLIDEIRSRDVYAVLMTHSTAVLDYVKSPSEVVLLSLENGETKARMLGEEVKERLKKSGLTLSELIESGLLEAA